MNVLHSAQELAPEGVRDVAGKVGTPAYVYEEARLQAAAEAALAFPHAYGLTVRYAMKALPNATVVRLFDRMGLHIDASSGYEVQRALLAGVAPGRISLSSQELPGNFAEYCEAGVLLNACSLAQLEAFGAAFPGAEVGLRFNPGLGSGHTGKTNVGGPDSSFGIWHELAGEAAGIAGRHRLRVVRVHTHIGSGSDPEVWKKVARMSLELVRDFAEVTVLNLGGGYKVARMPGEGATDPQAVGAPVRALFEAFARETGRELHLEIEPGTFLVGNAGYLVARVADVVQTGPRGRRFLKLDTGMTEILRPSLYAAQHPVWLVPAEAEDAAARARVVYTLVGHCCESGDLLTPAPGDPEALDGRELPEARAGDFVVIGGAGAYCAAMSAKNYNSFPEAPEVLLGVDGVARLIRKRQTLEQVIANEITI